MKDDVSTQFRYEIGTDKRFPIDFQYFSDTGSVY